MAEPIMQLSKSVICKVDSNHGPNQKGWWNKRWMDTPVCNDFNVACDYCITFTLEQKDSSIATNPSKEDQE